MVADIDTWLAELDRFAECGTIYVCRVEISGYAFSEKDGIAAYATLEAAGMPIGIREHADRCSACSRIPYP